MLNHDMFSVDVMHVHLASHTSLSKLGDTPLSKLGHGLHNNLHNSDPIKPSPTMSIAEIVILPGSPHHIRTMIARLDEDTGQLCHWESTKPVGNMRVSHIHQQIFITYLLSYIIVYVEGGPLSLFWNTWEILIRYPPVGQQAVNVIGSKLVGS